MSNNKLKQIGQKESFHTTLENLLEGCQIIDFEYRYLFINNAAAKQGHKTAEELHGHTMMEMYRGIEITPMFSILRQCMQERIPRQMENKFNFDDGTNGWFHLSFEPVPEGVFIMSTNITDRKQAATELVIANKKLAFENKEKDKRAAELIIANEELAFENKEKDKRAAELVIANEEKEKRASELGIANIELAYQDEEKGKRAAELI